MDFKTAKSLSCSNIYILNTFIPPNTSISNKIIRLFTKCWPIKCRRNSFPEQSIIIIIDPDEMMSNTRHKWSLHLYLYQFLCDNLQESKIQNESQGGFSHPPHLVWLKSTSVSFTRGAIWCKFGNGTKSEPNRWWEHDPDQTQLLEEIHNSAGFCSFLCSLNLNFSTS